MPNSGPFTTRDNISGYAKLSTSGFTAKYTQTLSFATLTVIGDYSHLQKDYQEDSDASPYTLFEFFNGSNVDQQSIEARLNGGDEKLNWTAGVYGLRIAGNYYEGWIGPSFFTSKEFNNGANPNDGYLTLARAHGPMARPRTGPPAAFPGPDGGIPATKSPYDLTTKSYAVFGQLEYRATDLLGFTVGARFTGDKKDYNFTWYPYEYFPTAVTNQTLLLTQPDGATLTSYSRAARTISTAARHRWICTCRRTCWPT